MKAKTIQRLSFMMSLVYLAVAITYSIAADLDFISCFVMIMGAAVSFIVPGLLSNAEIRKSIFDNNI